MRSTVPVECSDCGVVVDPADQVHCHACCRVFSGVRAAAAHVSEGRCANPELVGSLYRDGDGVWRLKGVRRLASDPEQAAA